MKGFKKFIALLCVALFCLLPVVSQPITAHASQPVTWYLKYVDSIGQWRYQNDTWQENGYHRELYYMHEGIKDGDLIVIDGTADINLEVNVRLSNLTVMNTKATVVKANGIDDFYALANSVSAINGNVTNAYVYGQSVVNFNDKVANAYLYDQCTVHFAKDAEYVDISTAAGPDANVTAAGKIAHLKGWDGGNWVAYDYYNVAAGKLDIYRGTVRTDAAHYSTTAPSAPAAPSTPAAPSAPAGEYDDVPKTGQNTMNPLWLCVMAAVCLAGGLALKKSER